MRIRHLGSDPEFESIDKAAGKKALNELAVLERKAALCDEFSETVRDYINWTQGGGLGVDGAGRCEAMLDVLIKAESLCKKEASTIHPRENSPVGEQLTVQPTTR